MNKYELMVIVDAGLSQEDKDSIYSEVKDAINKGDGKILNNQVWIDRQKMTFPIKKKLEGTYYLINFETQTKSLGRIKELIGHNERLLRSAIFRAEE